MREAKQRSVLAVRRLDDIVALHRHGRSLHEPYVVAVADKATAAELHVAPAPGTDDGQTVLALIPLAVARAWLAHAEGLNKWEKPDQDAMDVAVVAAGGALLMRLTARC
jgi:hypothetical protein